MVSSEGPVPPITMSGKILEAPEPLLNEDTVWGGWLREPNIGVAFAVVSWISWLGIWVGVEICSFRGC